MVLGVSFRILDKNDIELVVPIVRELSGFKVSEEVLRKRFLEMVEQNYKCAVMKHKCELIGVCGMWFCTRHYSGKTIEIDHIFIKKEFRNQGLGKKFMQYIYDYAERKGVEAIELNAYLKNEASHRFYNNEGFKALAYHFVKPLNGKWPGE